MKRKERLEDSHEENSAPSLILTALMRPRLPRTSLISITFHPNAYLPSTPMSSILSDSTHVLRPQVLSRLQSRPKKGLWIRVSANGFASNATVRRWAKRRVQEALREDLKVRGLGVDGIGLDGQRTEVRGTMEVKVKKEAVVAEWSDVRAEMGRVVEAVVGTAGTKEEWR
ncbi:MAG: hypothetical protein Q9181_001537 [Wetmoreana brouardii]